MTGDRRNGGESAHTPGFWKIDFGHQTKRPRGISSAARNIVNFGGLASPSSAETLANARLICAAPALLEALKAYVHLDEMRGNLKDKLYLQALDAIEGATGEQP